MAKPDKAELKKQGEILKAVIAQARKKTLNFALLQGKDQMYLETHLKKNPMMLRKEAKKAGGGPKAAMGTLKVEGKNLVFSVEEEPPGPFPKMTKKHFMMRGIPVRVTFKLPNGMVIDDGEEDEDAAPGTPAPQAAPEGDVVSDPPVDNAPPEPVHAPEPDDRPDQEPNDMAGYGASILDMFGGLQDELTDKMNKAGDDMRADFQDLTDKFNESHIGEEFDKAAGYLSELQKQLSEFVEDPAKAFEITPDMRKKANDIIARGVQIADIQKKTAEENIDKLKDMVLAEVAEIGDQIVEFTKPIADKINKMIAEMQLIAASKEKLQDMGLTDDQIDDLADLSVDSPKSFDAALRALQSMDTEFGDIIATPAGIAEMRKNALVEQAASKAASDKYHAALAAQTAADDALTAAQSAEAAAQKKVDLAEAALIKLKSKLPKDLSTLTETQKKALMAVAKAVKSQRELLGSAKADVANKTAIAKTKTDAFTAEGNAYFLVQDAYQATQEKIVAAEVKKRMLDSLEVGVLSADAPKPMKDEDVAKILEAIGASTELGNLALDLVETSKDKENVAKGAGMLAAGIKSGMPDKNGNTFGDKDERIFYALSALKVGNAMGGSYFDDMDAYIAKGGLNEPTTLSFAMDSAKMLEQERAKYVGGAMIGADGKIDVNSPKAKAALDMVNFHPEVIANATPAMNTHFAGMAKKMDDPAHKQKIQDVLDGVTTGPTSKTGKDLLAAATGKAVGDLTADDIKSSVMSAMFTPLDQGPVGSCFATGPARTSRDKNPAKAMADMVQIATKGTFTTAQGLEIKAIKINTGTTEEDIKKNKLPLDDNPLMRSWEYSIATAGTQFAGSYEEKQLDRQLWTTDASADPNGENLNALGDIDGMENWAQVKSDLKNLIHDELDFRYNSTSDIKIASDGHSTKGNFEIFNNGKIVTTPAGAITTKADFIKVISGLAINAAKAKDNAELSQKIIAHCSSQAFIDSVCLKEKGVGTEPDKISLPWAISGGGIADPMAKVLEGGEPNTTDVVPDNKPEGEAGHQSPGERTKKVMTAMMTSFIAQGSDVNMIGLETGGMHGFGGLPNHPSLQVLKEGGDLGDALDEHLLKPAQEMAAKKLDEKTVGVLFDKQISALGKKSLPGWVLLREDEKGIELLEAARAKRPDEMLTSKELKAVVDAAAQPVMDYISTRRADNWKADLVADNKPPTDAEYAEKLKKAKERLNKAKESVFDNSIINTFAPQEFVFADSNWGSGKDHTFFVVIADPVSGEPKMFQREEPSGKLSAMDDDWLDTNWRVMN